MKKEKYILTISVGDDVAEVRHAMLSPEQVDMIKKDVAGELNRQFEIEDITGEKIESGIIDNIEKIKTYKVYVSEIRYGSVLVEAGTKEEAEKLAKGSYENDKVWWHERELSDVSAEGEKE